MVAEGRGIGAVQIKVNFGNVLPHKVVSLLSWLQTNSHKMTPIILILEIAQKSSILLHQTRLTKPFLTGLAGTGT